MRSILKKVPPIAFPVRFSGLFYALDHLNAHESLDNFEKSFAQYFNLKSCFALTSGRAALTVALKILKKLRPDKSHVIIPAYTCPTVPLSVAKAGLKVKLCDIELETLNIDLSLLEKIADDETLCIIAPHLLGYSCNMDRLMDISGNKGIYLIEDVAQSAGSKWRGQKIGTFGQLACFSLGRGKSLTTYEGGVLGIRDESLVKFFDEEIDNIKPQDRISSLKNFVKLSSMGLLQNPRAWWFISKLPLGFEQQYHSIDFDIKRLSNWQAAFGNLVLKRLDEINKTRVRNGKYLINHLRFLRDIKIPEESESAETIYLRLPIIFNTTKQRELMYDRLNKAGIGTSRFYRCSLNRYNYLRDIVPQGEYPAAQYVAHRILALSTHPLMEKRDLDLIIEVFKQNVRS